MRQGWFYTGTLTAAQEGAAVRPPEVTVQGRYGRYVCEHPERHEGFAARIPCHDCRREMLQARRGERRQA